MNRTNRIWNLVAGLFLAVCLIIGAPVLHVARADSAPQPLPFTLDWSNTDVITTLNDWSGVPGVVGYLGEGLGGKVAGVNPQTILVDGTNTSIRLTPDVIDPNKLQSAGVAEFELADPIIGLSGSNAPHAPFLLINLDTTGRTGIHIEYDVRDLESSEQDAVQQMALHYRVGSTGNFTNLPGGYVADATEPNLATKVTHVAVTLPANADNQPRIQVRIMTANAVGRDEWVGIDNIVIDGAYMPDDAPEVGSVTPASDATLVPVTSGMTVTFSEPVAVSTGWLTLNCAVSGEHLITTNNTDSVTYTIDPEINFASAELCTATVLANHVSDLDGLPPEHMAADYSWSFTTANTPPMADISCADWVGLPFPGMEQITTVSLDNPATGPSMPHTRVKIIIGAALPENVAELGVYDALTDTWDPITLTVDGSGLVGWFGPDTGFEVLAPSARVKLFRLNFNRSGEYPVTFQWVDLDTAPVTVMDECAQTVILKTRLFLPLIFR